MCDINLTNSQNNNIKKQEIAGRPRHVTKHPPVVNMKDTGAILRCKRS